MFAYANGNPVMMIDPDGRTGILNTLLGAIALIPTWGWIAAIGTALFLVAAGLFMRFLAVPGAIWIQGGINNIRGRISENSFWHRILNPVYSVLGWVIDNHRSLANIGFWLAVIIPPIILTIAWLIGSQLYEVEGDGEFLDGNEVLGSESGGIPFRTNVTSGRLYYNSPHYEHREARLRVLVGTGLQARWSTWNAPSLGFRPAPPPAILLEDSGNGTAYLRTNGRAGSVSVRARVENADGRLVGHSRFISVTSHSSFTFASQRETDLRLQRLAANAVENQRIAWNNASNQAQRETVLTNLFNSVRSLMGITHPGVTLSLEVINGGLFNTETGAIRIDNRPNSISILNTVVHELRHAYQWEAVRYNRHVVTDETRNAWRDNMPPNYTFPIIENGILTNAGPYLSQPVEFDAIMFSRDGHWAHMLRWQRDYPPVHFGSWQSQWNQVLELNWP